MALTRRSTAKTVNPSKTEKAKQVEIPPPQINLIKTTVVGDSPLLIHRFSEKAKKQIEDKRALGAQAAKGALVPEVEYKAAMYDMGRGKTGIKASAFKMAMVDACPFVGSIPKTKARGSFFVMGDLLEIRGKHHMHTAHARNPTTKNADIRYRPEYAKWEVDLVIRYNANVISPAQILNLLANAGFSIGVGDWRPAKSGTHGMFHVKGK